MQKNPPSDDLTLFFPDLIQILALGACPKGLLSSTITSWCVSEAWRWSQLLKTTEKVVNGCD